jgi:SHS2 domain-containing protein
MKYRIFDHTADLGIEVHGETLSDLFANAVLAIADMTADTDRVRARQTKVIEASGADRDDLWVNFLRESLYAVNGEHFLIKECHIKQISDTSVTAEIKGEPFDPDVHRIKKEIKAVTYHQASINQDGPRFKGRVILDV